MRIIAIDFDGCLSKGKYPEAEVPNWPVIWQAQAERRKGSKLILWTCRAGKDLNAAVKACKAWGLTFDAVNDNLPEVVKIFGGSNCRKVNATEYWDDRSVTLDTLYRRQDIGGKMTRARMSRRTHGKEKKSESEPDAGFESGS